MDITIRAASLCDAQDLFQIHTQPHVVKNTLQLPYPTQEMWHQRFSNEQNNQSSFRLVAEINKPEKPSQVIGNIVFEVLQNARLRHTLDFGMAVDINFSGLGVGTTLVAAMIDMADNWLNIRRIQLEVYRDNETAIALYKKFGFEVEGTRQDYAYRDGQYVDALLMARIKH
ncbi:GNAT family N-acetyltransferase [Algicola sagamiensis]|uniref:GNAT family N-acetyltransferase n=1 Tax=Algicola sagamiensis TaxID=163869 RepID=UPI0003618957|nr:GNAT family N-acetyltransferase [Algicola sagamiensis]